MDYKEFLHHHCQACGGNWAAMLMSGIRECFPETYAKMEDREYDFEELIKISKECGVNW